MDLISGLELYNQGEYWDCHEDLEEKWLQRTYQNEKYIFWAVIQVATALYHVERQNIAGARGMIIKSKEKIEKSLEAKLQSKELDSIDWSTFAELVMGIPNNPDFVDFNELKKFKFNEVWK